MASKYYGSKGNTVVEIQKQLNKLGADLTLDGIWGKNTEAAYNTYKNYLGSSETQASTFNMKEYTPLTDQQIKQTAVQKAEADYDWQIAQAKDSSDFDKYLLDQKKAALSDTYDAKEKALQKAYAQTKKEMAQKSLSKGMGRSSYASDVQEGAKAEQSEESAALRSELGGKIKDIDDQIAKTQLELLQQTEKLSQKKQAELLKTIASLQEERQNTLTKVLEYNNSLALKLKKLKG